MNTRKEFDVFPKLVEQSAGGVTKAESATDPKLIQGLFDNCSKSR
jgi:hypothetical protein